MSGTTESCACRVCQGACRHKPGWFKPGEPERTAEHLGLTLAELFAKYLMVDWWIASEDIFLLSPATIVAAAGEMSPAEPRGRCVFFEDGRCRIHAAKPFECRAMLHSNADEQAQAIHEEAARAWDAPEHRAQIKELLGREPEAAEYSIFSAFGFGNYLGGDEDGE